MSASAIIFYLLSAFILGAGLLAVCSKKIFRAAIWLLFCLIGVAARQIITADALREGRLKHADGVAKDFINR